MIVLTNGGESRVTSLLELVGTAAGVVTLLERPMMAVTLWRSVQFALRSRRRQYEVRDLLGEQQRRRRELEEAQSALLNSEAALAAELSDTKQLQRISTELIHADDVNALYEQLIQAAMALMRSDMASLQRLYPERKGFACSPGRDLTRPRRRFGSGCVLILQPPAA
jgi:hypothetical protein